MMIQKGRRGARLLEETKVAEKFVNKNIYKYMQIMRANGYSKKSLKTIRCTLNVYEESNEGEYEIEKIHDNIARGKSKAREDYIAYLTRIVAKYAHWKITGEVLTGDIMVPKSGLWRPRNCLRDCVYNYGLRCTYNPEEELAEVLRPHRCKYFKKSKNILKPKEKAKPYDYIYCKPCAYKDSHAAMWSE